MFNHVAKYNWRLHYDRLRPSVLGGAPRNSSHLRASDTEHDDEIVRSAETDHEIRAYLHARMTGDDAAEADRLNNVVKKWDADNAAGGVGVHAHLALPKPFAAVLARELSDANQAEQASMFDDLIKKFEPSVRTLVAQQIGGQMRPWPSHGRNLHNAEEAVGNESGGLFDSRETLRRAMAEHAPWLQLRPRLRSSYRASSVGINVADEGEAGPGKASAVRPLTYEPERENGVRSYTMERKQEVAGTYQNFGGNPQGGRASGSNTPAARPQGSPYNPKVDDVAKDLQYHGYDPALLSKNMPGWRPLLLFDDRAPDGYSSRDIIGGRIRLNTKGFGGYLAHRKGTGDFAFMVKGVEVSEGRVNDVLANDYGNCSGPCF